MMKNFHLLIIGMILFIGFQLTDIPLWAGCSLTFLIWISFIAFNLFNIRRTLFVRSICRIRTNEKVVYLTFDDGPNPETTEVIISILESHHIKATFFCIGSKVKANEQLIRKMDSAGHTFGNHTFSHHWFDPFKNAERYASHINYCSKEINRATGKTPTLFRPPYGITTPAISVAIKKMRLTCIGWNIRSFDTIIKDDTKIVNRIIARLKPGSIILLHDSIPITVILLPKLIQKIQANGYKILSLPIS